MKKYTGWFFAMRPNCQQVKVDYQCPSGIAQNIDIQKWKSEIINMEFITSMSQSHGYLDSISVIVD